MLIEGDMPQAGNMFSIYAYPNIPDQCAVDLEPDFSSASGGAQ